MGNGLAKLTPCCTGGGVDADRRRRHLSAAVISDPFDDSLGHSFCYVRRDTLTPAAAVACISRVHHYAEEPTTFRSISGASLGANPATPLSTSLILFTEMTWPSSAAAATAFESSDSFASVPLQPIPRFSGPLSGSSLQDSRGFLSGPLERGFMSGPLDGVGKSTATAAAAFSGSLRRSLSVRQPRRAAARFFSAFKRVIRQRPKFSGDFSTSSSAADDAAAAEVPEPPPLQWAQGKAGEDRVHVVVSEEHGWMFVGIYDGFNGPDATDYLLSNLYPAANQELKGLLWDEESAVSADESSTAVNHGEVLKALSRALEKTEESYLDMADEMIAENHSELALMGSCVLVMLMKGDDVYVMNVGDSRAILGHKSERNSSIKEDISEGVEEFGGITQLSALQLTLDHSTSVEQEVCRIRNEHPDDSSAIANDRVKGSLKVTRAFGAGYLKQPKWNDALLEMFRVDYVGTAPYLCCSPFIHHHRLGPNDRFIILSSDGLYQYFTNEEAVAQVELFIEASPDGDPAQHLVEEILFRAARKAGMDFHELLEIPQGDRRRYHDDVSIIVISLEGRIWKSCV